MNARDLPFPTSEAPIDYPQRGTHVKFIRKWLGHSPRGPYTKTVKDCVRMWQETRGLIPDGLVGPQTWAHMLSAFDPLPVPPEVDATPPPPDVPPADEDPDWEPEPYRPEPMLNGEDWRDIRIFAMLFGIVLVLAIAMFV